MLIELLLSLQRSPLCYNGCYFYKLRTNRADEALICKSVLCFIIEIKQEINNIKENDTVSTTVNISIIQQLDNNLYIFLVIP